jgi:hypothetical protein
MEVVLMKLSTAKRQTGAELFLSFEPRGSGIRWEPRLEEE